MASTRNKNTPGNYYLDQKQYAESRTYTTYKHSAYGEAVSTNLPGNGLLPAQLPGNTMSYNSIDTESFLFGINSTNLTETTNKVFTPENKTLTPVNLYENGPIYIPEPLVIQTNQRPQFN